MSETSSISVDGVSGEESYTAQPQAYTSNLLQERERDNLRRKKTREEQIESDEEYLNSIFPEDDMDDDLSLEQNVDLYLMNSSHDMIGAGRHLSIGMDQRPASERRRSTFSTVEENPPIERRESIINTLRRVSTLQQIRKLHIWEAEFKKERIKVLTEFFRIYLVLGCGFIVVLCFYWGSLYRRDRRYHNLRMLVVSEDTQVGQLPPLIGETVLAVAQLNQMLQYGNWEVQNITEFTELARSHNNTVFEEVRRQINHRNYWSAIYVSANATANLYGKLLGQDLQTSTLIQAINASGRDPILSTTYISNLIRAFQTLFLQAASSNIYPALLSSMTPSQISSMSIDALSDPLLFDRIDLLPIVSPVIYAPLQLGLVYLVVFAFFQFLLSLKVQGYVSARVKGAKYILFRIVTSQVAYLIISLSYSTLNAAFGLNYKATFGNSGFLVMWTVLYLTVASLGGLNENMALICFAYFPPLIGLWLVFLVVINISPTFSPIALCPTFYRYGYAMPVHCSNELFKIIFYDGYKGTIGLNIGILLIWMVVTNLMLPFTLKHVANLNKRRLELLELEKEKEKELEKEKERSAASSKDTSASS